VGEGDRLGLLLGDAAGGLLAGEVGPAVGVDLAHAARRNIATPAPIRRTRARSPDALIIALSLFAVGSAKVYERERVSVGCVTGTQQAKPSPTP
jgi:hypothetical protein